MQNFTNKILEVCASSIESARAAAEGGAQRIELCTALELDGLTPSAEEIREARNIDGLKVNVLIRSREGGFVYSDEEIDLMMHQITQAKQMGVDGIVMGALTQEGDIDIKSCQRMMEAAAPLPVTFHRAFDKCRNPEQALEDIIALGCRRLLTSGQAATAEVGIPLLRKLQEQSRGRIIIMPGVGVNPGNAAQILQSTGCTEIHSSARKPGEGTTDATVVKEIVKSIQSSHKD